MKNYIKPLVLGLTLFLGTIYAIQLAGTLTLDGNLCFEGSTLDDFELCLVPTDPGSDLNITVPAATDTMTLIAATQTLTNKTIDGESNIIELRRAATDCTAETGGKVGELCYEQDAKTLYICEPSAGDCDTAGEWFLASGASSTPDYILYRRTFGEQQPAGTVNTGSFLDVGASSTVTVLGGGTLRPPDGALLFDDAATEILYVNLGILPSGYDYTNISVTMSVQNRQSAASNIVFNLAFACLGDGDASPTSFSSGPVYSTPEAFTSTPDTTTVYDIYIDTVSSLDATTNSSGCAAGKHSIMSITRDNTDANTQPAAVWDLMVTVPAS